LSRVDADRRDALRFVLGARVVVARLVRRPVLLWLGRGQRQERPLVEGEHRLVLRVNVDLRDGGVSRCA
jgi:hypothetical protein